MKNKVGRPPSGKPRNYVRLPLHLWDTIGELAAKSRRTKDGQIEEMINEAMYLGILNYEAQDRGYPSAFAAIVAAPLRLTPEEARLRAERIRRNEEKARVQAAEILEDRVIRPTAKTRVNQPRQKRIESPD